LQQFWAREAKLAGFDGELGGERFEAAQLFGFEQAGALTADVASAAGDGAEDAVAFEILVGAGDGVGVDAEFGGQFADRGEGVVELESPGGNGVFDLGLDLEIDGSSGASLYSDKHLY
jgi:hypothetical protein